MDIEEFDTSRPMRSSKRKKQGLPYWQLKAARAARMGIVAKYPRGSGQSISVWGPTYKTADPIQQSMRKALRYTGDGAYSLKSLGRNIMRYGGAAIGGALGAESGGLAGIYSGAQSGYAAGKRLSRFAGLGEYTSNNQLIAGPGENRSIAVNNDHRSGDIVFCNTEFFQNVYASVASAPSTSAFQLTSFAINPGVNDLFPFLSQIAQNFELYEFEGLMIEYKPTSGEYGNNSSNSIGKVVLCTNYDPDAANFTSSMTMENYDYANSTKPSQGAIHGIETHPAQRSTTLLYVRSGESSRDKVFTDLGNFQIATEGIPFGGTGAQTALVGELWVTYKVRLSRSQLYSSVLGSNILFDTLSITNLGGEWATAVTHASGSTMNVTLADTGGDAFTLTFPTNIDQGYFEVSLYVPQSPAAASPGDLSITVTNGTGGGMVRAPGSSVSTSRSLYRFYVQVNAPSQLASCVVNCSFAASVNASTADMWVNQISQAQFTAD